MALARQLIDIPFAAGLGQKDDPKQLAPPKLLTLENGDFTTLKQIRKRPQLRSKGTTPSNKGVLGVEYRDECLALDGESLFSLAGGTFKSKGVLPIVSATAAPGARTQAIAVDSAATAEMRISVWQSSDDVIHYTIVHIATGQVLYTGSLSGGYAPKVAVLNGNFVVFFINDDFGDQLYLLTISVPTVSVAPTVGAPTMLTPLEEPGSGWVDSDRRYDVCAQGSRIYVVAHYGYFSGGAARRTVKVLRLSDTFTPTELVSPLPSWLAASATLSGVAVIPDWNRDGLAQAGVMVLVGGNMNVYGLTAQPVLYDDTDGVASYAYQPNYRQISSGNSPRFITGIVNAATDTLLATYAIPVSDGVSETHFELGYTAITTFSKVSSQYGTIHTVLAERVRPCAKLFSYTDNLGSAGYVLPVIHESAMQPTIFALKIIPNDSWTTFTKCWAARYLPALAGGYSTNVAGLPLKWTQPYDVLPESSGGKFATVRRTDSEQTGVDTLSFAASSQASAAEYADNLHVAAGGVTWMYDGNAPVEHGFLMAPTIEERPFADGPGSGSHIYAYRFLYAWPDARGQTHRSAPAPEPIPTDGRPGLFRRQTTDPIDSSHKVTMKIPSLVETAKTGVVIEIYRTTDASQGGGTVYYLAGTVPNGANGLAVEFQDGMPDDYDGVSTDFLREQMQCYTEGGVVQNDPAPASNILLEHDNRLWTVDVQSPGVLAYSRSLIPVQAGAPGVPAEFSSYFQTRVSSTGDEVAGIGSLDEKLIVFLRDGIGVIVGSGPDDTGGGGSFSFNMLPHKVGVIKHGSIVSTSKGLIFQSDQGFLMLDRSLQVQPVGLDVETFAKAADIVFGLALTTATQVHMLDAANNRLLAYDTLTEQWSMWPLPSAPACIFSYGTAVEILLANGVLLEETAWSPVATYGDAGAWVSCKVGTGWVKLTGIAGYERLRRIWLTGEFKSAHKLHWALYQDYDAVTPVQSGTFTVSAATAKGGYQVRIDVVRQKCESFSIVVYDAAPDSGAIGEGMRLSGITLEVGAKMGGLKLPTPQITG